MTQAYQMFGQRLVERGVISQKQLDEAIHKKQTSMGHRRLGEILVRLGYIGKQHIMEGLSDQLEIPIINLADREIPDRIRNLIEPNVATVYRVIPVSQENGTLTVATADPTNVNALDNLERLLELQVTPVIATEEDIANALGKYYGLQETTVESMLSTVSSASSMSTLSTMSNVSSMASSLSSVGSMSASDISLDSISMESIDFDASQSSGGIDDDMGDDDSPVVKYINYLILEAFRVRASDIHIEPGKLDLKIRYRIDGVLHLMPPPPKRAQPSIVSRLKIMSGMDIAERRIPQDGRIKLAIAGKMVDLRVSALPSVHGETIVMRILDKSGLMLGLGQLGFTPTDQQKWEALLALSNGVILVTGPTGSGKTTTLYASLHQLNTTERKLITVEDPVEYQLSGINQVQINHDIGWNFARALRSIVRQDPDIMMVGEIRDPETAEIAVKAALTGHLVFSTLHTNDAPSSFIRLVDIGIKPYLVAAGVRAILAQRLVRTICTNCKERYEATDMEKELLYIDVDWNSAEIFQGKGCDNCNQTGYQGRLGVYELLVSSDNLGAMVMAGESTGNLRRAARREGMSTMRDDAWVKVQNGITTVEEVIRVTQPDEILKAIEADAR